MCEKPEAATILAEYTVSSKQNGNSPLQNETGNKLKEEGASEGDFFQVAGRIRKKSRSRARGSSTPRSLPKVQASLNDRAPKEKVRIRSRNKSPALLIKSMEGPTFTEILSEIRYRIKSKYCRAQGSSIRLRSHC